MKQTWRSRLIVIGLLVLALAGVFAWAFRAKPVAVDLATAARGDLVLTVDEEGETRLKDVYVVSAPVAGRLQRVEIEVGDEVMAGKTILARFIPMDASVQDARSRTEAEAGVRVAQADRVKALSELEYAETEAARATQLLRVGAMPAVVSDKAQLAAKTARATLAQATAVLAKRQADVDNANAVLSPGRFNQENARVIPVTSPVSGRVIRRIQQSEQILAAGTPLLEVGDTTRLEIVTDVLSADAVRVREGAEVIVEEWGGTRALRGVVRRVEPFGFTKVSALGIEEQRVNIVTDFISPPDEWRALGHGYRVMTRIVVDQRNEVITIPVNTLFREGEVWSVFAVAQGRARLRVVTVGLKTPFQAEVTGLEIGAQVIVHPSDKVADGVKIESRE